MTGKIGEARIEAAVGLGAALRSRVIRAFFLRFPGPDRPPGLGRALIDFVDWLLDSGRLDDSAGSPWWKALNGCLILDLADAVDAGDADHFDHFDGSGGDGARAWLAYGGHSAEPGSAGLQDRLWHAHQVSLHRAIPACWDLLEAETEYEQAFIETAMEIVDLAALRSQPTDTAALAESTRRLYPGHYPLTAPYDDDLARVRRASLRAHTGPRVGLHSAIWTPRRRAS